MSSQEVFEQWRKHQEAELEHIKAEIFKANSYLQCLYQLRDAAVLCSFPGGLRPSMEVKNMVVGEWKENK
jgi:hypothetical protein